MNALGDGPAVPRFKDERAQDQEVQGTLRKINSRVRHLLPYGFYREHTLPLVEAQGEDSELSRPAWEDVVKNGFYPPTPGDFVRWGELVPERGLEPPRPCDHCDLNAARLPVPPLGHECGEVSSGHTGDSYYEAFSFCPALHSLSTR